MFGMFGLVGAVLDAAVCDEKPRVYHRPSYDLDDFIYDLDREAEIERLRREKRELEEAKERLERMIRELD